MLTSQDLFHLARERVLASPRLAPYAEVILADWPEAESHMQWVIAASEDDIIAWAQDADLRAEQEDGRDRA